MRRLPSPVPVEDFLPKELHAFVELDRIIYNFIFENSQKPDYELAKDKEFLEVCSLAFSEEQKSMYREISFGDFVIESLETYTFSRT